MQLRERAGGQAHDKHGGGQNADNDAEHAAGHHFAAKADNARDKHQNAQRSCNADAKIHGHKSLQRRDNRGRAERDKDNADQNAGQIVFG